MVEMHDADRAGILDHDLRDVLAHRPDLVIWQAGANEVLKGAVHRAVTVRRRVA